MSEVTLKAIECLDSSDYAVYVDGSYAGCILPADPGTWDALSAGRYIASCMSVEDAKQAVAEAYLRGH
jgi:hypothetical protein